MSQRRPGCDQQGAVPATYDVFLEQYSSFITWAIKNVTRGHVRPADLPDLTQMIHLRIIEKDYLTRCRQLLAERGTGQFSTLLYWLIRSVLVNQFAKNRRNPLNMALGLNPVGFRPRGGRSGGLTAPAQSTLPGNRFIDVRFEERIMADITLDRFARYVETTRRGAQLAQALQLLYEGYAVSEIKAETGATKTQWSTTRQQLRSQFAAFSQAS